MKEERTKIVFSKEGKCVSAKIEGNVKCYLASEVQDENPKEETNVCEEKQGSKKKKEKETELRKKQSVQNKPRKWTVILTVIFAMLIIASFISFTAIVDYKIFNLTSGSQETESLVSMHVSEGVIAIISLAVAVWAALNITSALDKRDIEETKEKYNEIAHTHQKVTMDLLQSKKNIRGMSKNVFLQEILIHSGIQESKYFYNLFLKAIPDFVESSHDEADLSEYMLLTKIEQINAKLHDLHSSVDSRNLELTELVKENIRNIKEFRSIYADTNILKAVEDYLIFREGCCYFYSGYAHDEREGMDEEFKKAYSEFEKSADIFLMLMSHYEKYFTLTGNYKKELKINELDSNFYRSVLGKNAVIQLDSTEEMESGMAQMLDSILNIVGESYSKILHVYKKAKNKGVTIILKGEVEDYGNRAIFYCKSAVEVMRNLGKKNEMYYRNLGCAYERYGWNKGFHVFKTETLYCYKCAFQFILNDPKTPARQVKNVYHVLLQYYNRLICHSISGYDSAEKLFEVKDLNSISSIEPDFIQGDVLKQINDFYEASEMAVNEMPRIGLHYIMHAYACLWFLALKHLGFKIPKQEKEFYEEISKMLQKVKFLDYLSDGTLDGEQKLFVVLEDQHKKYKIGG